MSGRASAEREFLAASVAVWREIDRLTDESGVYPGLPQSTELRKRERAAWERYRATLPCECPPGYKHDPACHLVTGEDAA